MKEGRVFDVDDDHTVPVLLLNWRMGANRVFAKPGGCFGDVI